MDAWLHHLLGTVPCLRLSRGSNQQPRGLGLGKQRRIHGWLFPKAITACMMVQIHLQEYDVLADVVPNDFSSHISPFTKTGSRGERL